MIGRAVFEFPAAPRGRDDSGGPLVRIVDPRGAAIAWLATGRGAGCVGFAVRRAIGSASDWTHVSPATDPSAAGVLEDDAGCPVLVFISGGDSTADSIEWMGEPLDPDWTLVERDPTIAVLEATIPVGSVTNGQPIRSHVVRLRLLASLEDAALSLRVSARNESSETISMGLGLKLAFSGNLFPTRPPDALLHLPGQSTPRPLTPAGIVHHQPKLEGAWTGLIGQPGATLLIGGGAGGAGVEILLESGIRSLAVHTTGDREAVMLTLGNAPPGGSLVRLAPGAATTVGVTIGSRFAAAASAAEERTS